MIRIVVFVFNLIFLLPVNNQEIQMKGVHFVIARKAKEPKLKSFPISLEAFTNGSKSALLINIEESNGPKGEPLLIHV